MKKVYLIVLSLGLLLFINACTDDEGNIITDPTSLIPSMSATINGNEWSANAPVAGFSDSLNQITVYGVRTSDSSAITLIINNPAEQLFELNNTTIQAYAIYNGLNYSSTGEINITKYSGSGNSMSGTFNFTTEEGVVGSANTITSGSFSNVIVSGSVPTIDPLGAVPAISAEVDGDFWKAAAPGGLYLASQDRLSITAVSTQDSSTISFTITNPRAQTYDLSDTTDPSVSVFYGFQRATSGTINMENFSLTKNFLSGTFNFQTDSTILGPARNVTNGILNNVPVTQQ